MYVCMHVVCMYVCIYVYMYVSSYVCMYVCQYVHDQFENIARPTEIQVSGIFEQHLAHLFILCTQFYVFGVCHISSYVMYVQYVTYIGVHSAF